MSWKAAVVAVGVLGLLVASFVLPTVLNRKTTPAGAARAMAMGAEPGAGLPVGSAVPAFSERDLVSGSPVTSVSVERQKTLLFFSEGITCQACFEQIRGLEQVGAELRKRGIRLLSITLDPPGDLEQGVSQYGITTSVISDSDGNMSGAFNVLGQGMHAGTPGHAFALIYGGKVLWYRDYWLAPYRTMYVQPQRLLQDIARS